jgi:hypothetical protein
MPSLSAMSTLPPCARSHLTKDEGEHRRHGKRKAPQQWREIKTKGRERRKETK